MGATAEAFVGWWEAVVLCQPADVGEMPWLIRSIAQEHEKTCGEGEGEVGKDDAGDGPVAALSGRAKLL
jgi:hypothetical protein